MEPTWIVVANAGRARFFAEPGALPNKGDEPPQTPTGHETEPFAQHRQVLAARLP